MATYIRSSQCRSVWLMASRAMRDASARECTGHIPEFVPLSGGAPFAFVQMVATRRLCVSDAGRPGFAGCWPCYASSAVAGRGDGGRGPARQLPQEVHGVRVGMSITTGGPARCCSCGGRCLQATGGIGAGGLPPVPADSAAATGFADSCYWATARDTCTDLLYNRRPFWRSPRGGPGGRFCKRQVTIAATSPFGHLFHGQTIDCQKVFHDDRSRGASRGAAALRS